MTVQYNGTCAVCGAEFTAVKAAKKVRNRVTCSRSCAVSLAWKEPDKRAQRLKNMSEGQKRRGHEYAEINRRRWARPGEREKLAERNRQMWSDPGMKKRIARAISAHHSQPENRKRISERKKKEWANPEFRRKMMEWLNGRKRSPEFRAFFSNMLRQRWQDPVWRKKWTEGSRRYRNKLHAKRAQPLTATEIAVLEGIAALDFHQITPDLFREICRASGVPASQIKKIVESLTIKRKLVSSRKYGGLRLSREALS